MLSNARWLAMQVKPDCVVLELCKARVQMLTMQEVQVLQRSTVSVVIEVAFFKGSSEYPLQNYAHH